MLFRSVKVTVSIPDDLIQAIDAQSERLGLSRSTFVAQIARVHMKALTDAERTAEIDRFLEQVSAASDQRRFNELYSGDEAVDPALTASARATFERNEW